MVLSHAKPFKEKMREQPVKTWKKKTKHIGDFSVNDKKPKHSNIYTTDLKACNFMKKRHHQHKAVFLCEISEFFKKIFSHKTSGSDI